MNYYDLLGISPTASFEEIKKIRNKMAHIYHTDRVQDDHIMKLINKAYETLSDPAKRAEYDSRVTAFNNPNSRLRDEEVRRREYDVRIREEKAEIREETFNRHREILRQLAEKIKKFEEEVNQRKERLITREEKVKRREQFLNVNQEVLKQWQEKLEKLEDELSRNKEYYRGIISNIAKKIEE